MAHVLDRPRVEDAALAREVKRLARPLSDGDLSGYDPLLEMIGDARIVLLGEASHGTHEFYRERARITTRLIQEKGFSFVAVEGDWPEACRVHQYVTGGPGEARDALDVFTVFPTWMWGNLDVLQFVEWLRRYNDSLSGSPRKVGFYGLDLYSVYASMQAVIDYLEAIDPEAAARARRRCECFQHFTSKDMYAQLVGLGLEESCEKEAVAMLQDLLESRRRYVELSPDDAQFYAEISARAAKDGERYYRSMYQSDEISWNLRDTHMQDTLDALLEHFGPNAKAVVWEHNTHIGDFRATADADGMVNVGQLTRERHPGGSVAIGFGCYQGSVTAARGWGDPPEYMRVPQAPSRTYDNVFHQSGLDRFLLLLQPLRESGAADGLNDWRGQRAIGVVYHPEYERGNYVPTRLAERYDAYIHVDRTRAVKPLRVEQRVPESGMRWDQESYPTGY